MLPQNMQILPAPLHPQHPKSTVRNRAGTAAVSIRPGPAVRRSNGGRHGAGRAGLLRGGDDGALGAARDGGELQDRLDGWAIEVSMRCGKDVGKGKSGVLLTVGVGGFAGLVGLIKSA